MFFAPSVVFPLCDLCVLCERQLLNSFLFPRGAPGASPPSVSSEISVVNYFRVRGGMITEFREVNKSMGIWIDSSDFTHDLSGIYLS